MYLLIKYIKSVLWRVAKRLSYIEDARCLKVNAAVILMISTNIVRHRPNHLVFIWHMAAGYNQTGHSVISLSILLNVIWPGTLTKLVTVLTHCVH